MRGVADQREPLADERARDVIAERKRARFALRLDVAEMQAKAFFELELEFVVRQRNDARRFAAPLGPHQRRALAGQRQDRERTGRQEMFLGAAAVVALVRDGDDDAGLVVVPTVERNAGALPQRRFRAVSGDKEIGRDRRAVAELDRNCLRRHC